VGGMMELNGTGRISSCRLENYQNCWNSTRAYIQESTWWKYKKTLGFML